MSRNRPQPRPGATEYSMQCDTCRTSVPAWDMGDASDKAREHNRVKHRNVVHAYPLCRL